MAAPLSCMKCTKYDNIERCISGPPRSSHPDEIDQPIDAKTITRTRNSSSTVPAFYNNQPFTWVKPDELGYSNHKFLINGLGFTGWLKLLIADSNLLILTLHQFFSKKAPVYLIA